MTAGLHQMPESILGLDLGSKTGWAFQTGLVLGERTENSGTWTLCSPKEMKAIRTAQQERKFDLRVFNLWERINVMADDLPGPLLVVFEDVQFSLFTAQTQLWASLRAAVWLSDAQHFDCVPVATLKKFATGHGGCTKLAMARALSRKGLVPHAGRTIDDNEVDAIFVLHWALTKYGKTN